MLFGAARGNVSATGGATGGATGSASGAATGAATSRSEKQSSRTAAADGKVTPLPEAQATPRGKVAPVLTKLNHRRVPHVAVWATAACIAVGIVITYLAPNNVYVWITSASAFADLWVWGVILASEIKFRKHANATGQSLSFPVPLWPATPILGLVLVVAAFIAIVVSPITRISVFSGVLFLVILLIWAGVASRRRSSQA